LISFLSAAWANFAIQYNFQSIAITLQMMSASVCTSDDGDCRSGDQAAWVSGTTSAVIFIGAVIGQLSMGFLGDYLSRNEALAATLFVSAMGALLSAVAPAGSSTSTYAVIVLFRFIIGVGLGGIYPLSATKASEDSSSADPRSSAYGTACVFAWQIPGTVAPWVVAYLLTGSDMSTGFRWRMVLGLGAVPCVLAILCLLIENHQKKGGLVDGVSSKLAVTSSKSDISVDIVMQNLRDPAIRAKLIGVGGSWLLYDIVFYGLTLLGGVVINDISEEDDNVSSDSNLRNICSKQSIGLSLGLVAVAATIFMLNYWNLKSVQITGFIAMGFVLTMLACFFSFLQKYSTDGLFVLYCISLMMLQFGVAVTVFTLPAALFEKDIRSTFNGIAAAGGKIGAIIGAYTFTYIANASIQAVLACCVVLCAAGVLVTYHYIDDADLAHDKVAASSHYESSSTDSPVRFSGSGTSSYSDTFSPMSSRTAVPITTQLSFNDVEQ